MVGVGSARLALGLHIGRRAAEMSLAIRFDYIPFNLFDRPILQRPDSQKSSLWHHLAGNTSQRCTRRSASACLNHQLIVEMNGDLNAISDKVQGWLEQLSVTRFV